MTRTSHSAPGAMHQIARKIPRWKGFVRRARVLLPLFAVACVVPLPFEEDTPDASTNFPPVVVESVPRMPSELGKFGEDIFRSEPETWTVVVVDKDPGDTLYTRVFRPSVDLPVLVFSRTTSPPGDGQIRRTIELDTAGWCSAIPDGEAAYFDVVVADRPFVDSSLSQDLAVPGGEKTVRTWLAVCQP